MHFRSAVPGLAVALSCKLNGADPQTYLADLLTRLTDSWP
ncbi:transposase domain-containing protein [Roseomonas sp. GCM10028921]